MSSAAKRSPVALVAGASRRLVTASDLLGGNKHLDVTFDNGLVLPIVYDPSVLTGASDREGLRGMAEGICQMVSEWDLADTHGPIPVGPDHVEDVYARASLLVLQRILQAIGEDNRPDPTSARS